MSPLTHGPGNFAFDHRLCVAHDELCLYLAVEDVLCVSGAKVVVCYSYYSEVCVFRILCRGWWLLRHAIHSVCSTTFRTC